MNSSTAPDIWTHATMFAKSLSMSLVFVFAILSTNPIAAQTIPECIDVFPAAATANAQAPDVLNLPSFPSNNLGALSLRNNGSITLGPGDFYYTSINFGNGVTLSVSPTTRIFVQGSVNFGNSAEINVGGNPEDLLIFVYGSASLNNNLDMNAILYAQGAISIGNNANFVGALTARGAISIGNTPPAYDRNAVEQAGFGDLCNNGPEALPQLLAEYRMEQSEWTSTAGDVLDTSGFERNATAVNGPDTDNADPAISGDPGTCRYGVFDGNNVVEQPGDWIEGLSAVTAMAWVYNEARLRNNDRGIFVTGQSGGRDNRFGMRYDSSGFFGSGNNVIKASMSTTECGNNSECIQVETVSNVMVQNQWQHVAMTWESGGNLKVFVDGIEAALSAQSGQGTGGVIDAVSELSIGQGTKNSRWQGRIDEFRIFDGALTESEIQTWKDKTAPCETLVPEHIRLLHPGSGLTCQPSQITVQACADASCSTLFNEQISVSFTSPTENWTPNPVTFTGQTTIDLQVTTPGFATLDAVADPPATGPTRCFIGAAETCQMEWLDTGFIINAPNHVSATTQTVTIAAVETDEQNQTCAAALGGETRTVAFWSDYQNPDTGTLPVIIENTGIPNGSPGTGIDIDFDTFGVATVDLRYDDVGLVRLNARLDGAGDEIGLVLTGQDNFIARPSTFTLVVPDNPAATNASGAFFTAAGTDFEIETQALNATGTPTPNFGRESSPETVAVDTQLVAPLPLCDTQTQPPLCGNNPTLDGTFGAFGLNCDLQMGIAGAACGQFSWPEVGIIDLTPRLASGAYLGTEDVVGNPSGPVGRFIPAYFDLSAGELIDRVELDECDDDFTYIGELFGANWTLTARNAQGITTGNYEGPFAKLTADALNIGADEDITIDSSSISWSGGVGTVTAKLSADRSAPLPPLEDFQVGTTPRDSDDVELDSLDLDLSEDGTNDHALIGTTELRFGRLALDNAVGSELGPLTLPLRAEYFEDGTWKPNALDACTAIALTDQVSATSSTGDSGDGTDTFGVGSGSTSIQENDPVTLDEGASGFTFSAPGSTGYVNLSLLLDMDWHFLRDDLDDDGNYLENPSARASFGLFEGNENRILLQEIPPQ